MPMAEMQQLAEDSDVITHRRSKPAQLHDHVGHARHAVRVRTTPHEQHEHLFPRHVAGQIDRAVIEHAAGAIVLCAPPVALGLLRDYLTDNSRKIIAQEIAKDYLHKTTGEIDVHMKTHNV
jgi:protein required for attachment to host cells